MVGATVVNAEESFSNGSRRELALSVERLADELKRCLGTTGISSGTLTKVSAEEPPSTGMASQLIGAVVARTVAAASAGTATAVVLAQAILSESVKAVTAGADPVEVSRGLEAAHDVVVGELRRQSRPVRELADLTRMAVVQVRGDRQLATLIAEAIDRVGADGAIALSATRTSESGVQWANGLQLDGGHLVASFEASSEQVVAEMLDVLVLPCAWDLTSPEMLRSAVALAAREQRALLVVTPKVSSEVEAYVRSLGEVQRVCVVEAPADGAERVDLLDDLAVICGGRVFASQRCTDLQHLERGDLGRANTVVIEQDRTTFIGGNGTESKCLSRARQIRAQLEDCVLTVRRRSLAERLGRFTGGVAVIPAGIAAPGAGEQRLRATERAVISMRSALRGGVVPGGGVALVRCLPALTELHVTPEQELGVFAMCRALSAPLRQIVENAGASGVSVDEIRMGAGAYGYNVLTGQCEDLVVAGVVDPTTVVLAALQSATAVASAFLVEGRCT